MKQNTLNSCSVLVKFGLKNPYILVLKGARDASGSSDPVPIAGDRGGDGSHCNDTGCERMSSIRKPSTSTFISRVNSSGV